MKMDDIATLAPADPLMVSPEVFQQIGSITRLLHDTMQQLGVMPKLQVATDGIPDARNRLVKSQAEMAWMNYWVLGSGKKFSWRDVLQTLEDAPAETKPTIRGP